MTERTAGEARLPLDPLFLGLYAWLSTVAVPALSADAPAVSPWLATLALLALFLAWGVAAKWALAADLLVALGFVGSSFATWVALGHARLTANLAELRTVVGAIGWGLFVVAWARARQTLRLRAAEAETPNTHWRSLGPAGNLQLIVALVLVVGVFLKVGLQSGSGRGVLVTTLALGWSIWTLDTSGLLATRLEHQSKGLGFGLFAEPRIILALGLAGVGYFTGRFVAT